MAAFKRPRRIEVVDQLPKTPTGKVRRFALRERLEVAQPGGAAVGAGESG
jgi:acyl-coenzyme A synthetase/AMP-(fatty) acid ligase